MLSFNKDLFCKYIVKGDVNNVKRKTTNLKELCEKCALRLPKMTRLSQVHLMKFVLLWKGN